MTVRTLAISCMILYLTLLSTSCPKPRWYVAGARPTMWGIVVSFWTGCFCFVVCVIHWNGGSPGLRLLGEGT
jgi:hypothetical protein